jgi:circadian clock protein KaiC
VILLDHRVTDHISTRMLRIVKYRGSVHGTNEYPFLIDEEGISVLPITSSKLDNEVSTERISSGISSLDEMLDGHGFFRGSSILVSGTAGTGKTSMAAYFAHETCKKKERCIFFSFEESPQQIIRNMRSIGIDLEEYVKKGLLLFHASRPTLYGLEMHLVAIHKIIEKFKPSTIVLDPITNLVTVGSMSDVKSMLIRLIDFLQTQQITVMFTALTSPVVTIEQTDQGVSSIVDAWITVRDIELNGERNRGLYIMKSRGMAHSNQVREFLITDDGLSLVDVFLGPDGVLVGSARERQQLKDFAGLALKTHASSRTEKEIARKKKVLEAKIAGLEEEFESVKDELNKTRAEEDLTKEIVRKSKEELAKKKPGNESPNEVRKKK